MIIGRLFDKNLDDPIIPRCLSVQMDLGLDNVHWVEVPASVPDEVWYAATVFYAFTFKMSDGNTYIANPGSHAQFTVRDARTGVMPHWQLVELRDLGASVQPLMQAAGTTPATLSEVEILCR